MAVAGHVSHSDGEAQGHFVSFYQAEPLLIDEVAAFVERALRPGGRAIVIAARTHLAAIRAKLRELGSGATDPAWLPDRFVVLDAEEALSRFMVDGRPDAQLFSASIGAVVAAMQAPGGGPLHAFGEMVSVLCERGEYEAALQLEGLWNALARRYAFTLFCAYSQTLFSNAEHSRVFEHICAAHTSVLPSEVLAGADHTEANRLVALWQQKAMALEREVERRDRAERQRERLVAELREASRAKDEFLAMLGHELRNPLTPIVTALRLMRLRTDGSTAREQDIIARQVEHLVRLVDDLLDVSRITRGKIGLKRQTVRVADVLTNAIEMAGLLPEQREHRLTVDIDPDLVWNVDATRLAQVVSNLLANAARYTAPGGHIELVAKLERSGMIAVSVRDDGIGLTPDVLARVFDLFFQGERNLDRAEGGLGIGLALVKNLVEMHGGQVSAASEGPGRGSTFVILVPGERIEHLELEPRAIRLDGVAAGIAPRRVLLVDDNVDGVQALAELLKECGHHVEAVYDPAAALDTVSRFSPEVAVIDIGLPGMDGYELVHRLRSEPASRACLFVALTGYGQDADRERSRSAGFHHHFVKPLDPPRLLHLIETLPSQAPSVTGD
jgi:signal transduction histidine kinase/ActR/RegA family two-component response regulator